MSMYRSAIGIAAVWMCVAAPVWGAERIYLLEQQAQGSAPYSFRTLGEIEGARRVAVPETGGHVLVLTALGRVWGWGQNLHGQLGTGDRAARAGFVEVPGLSEITAIAAGAQHSVALKSDGTVWTWGANTEGQLGDGSLVNRLRPGVVPGLRDVSMVAAGTLFTVALKSDGSVWAFGSNWNGIAGMDARKLVTEPVRVDGLSDVRAVAVRLGIGYALDGQGRIWVWGRGVENVAGLPRVLNEEERERVAGLVSAGSRLSVEWAGTGIEAASGVLRMRVGTAARTFAMDGTALDVASGWAVAMIAGPSQATAEGVRTPAGPLVMAGSAGSQRASTSIDGPGKAAGAAVVQVSTHGSTNLAVRSDGTVLGWGSGSSGSLGFGSGFGSFTPKCAEISGVRSVAGWSSHSLAIKQDGTVWSWGYGSRGGLGDGELTVHYRLVPAAVPGMSGALALAAGQQFSLVLKADGTVWAWGMNDHGQLGDGTTTDRAVPAQIQGLSGITSIAAGYAHALARRNDGAVFAWGSNYAGQVGDGTTIDRSTPVQVPSFTAESVAAGEADSLAIRNDKTLWVWGGILDENITTPVHSPVQVQGMNDVVFATGGFRMTGVQKADGSVWFWGDSNPAYDSNAQYVGLKPNTLNAPAGVKSFALGMSHIVLLMQDGTVRTWGSNSHAELGRADLQTAAQFVAVDMTTSCVVEGPKRFETPGRLAAGAWHSVVLQVDGTVWTAGRNQAGQIGDGTTSETERRGPTQVPGLSGITRVAAGEAHTLALSGDGRVFGWGLNSQSQLATGTAAAVVPSPVAMQGVSEVVSIAAGNTHSLAVRRDGTVWAWGSNIHGESGGSTGAPTVQPAQVAGLQDVVEVSAGVQFSIALKRDGTVWGWGSAELGQTPRGVSENVPKQVEGLRDVVAITSGAGFSIALRRDGSIWTWGDGSNGQLAAGESVQPVRGIARAAALVDFVAVQAGGSFGLALRSDGAVWSWGGYSGGALGDGRGLDSWGATPVPGFYAAAAIGAGAHSLAWKRDGAVWAWGPNDYGQFGVTTPTNSPTPMLSGFQQGYLVPTTPTGSTAVAGDTTTQVFDFQFRSAAGASTLRWVQTLFAAAPDGGGAPFCFLHYDVPGNGLWFYGVNGFFVGPVAPGTASNQLQNSYCAVNPKATTITKSGATLTLRTQVLFNEDAVRNIYSRSLDFNEVDSGWIQVGTWSSTPVLVIAPSVSPKFGSGSAPTFVATFDDASGLPLSTDGWVQLLVAAATDGGGQPFCYLHYDRAGDGLWMYSGDVGFFLGPVKPGVSSTVLDSSACSVNTAGTTVQNNAGQLVISAPFTLKSPMAGSKRIFQRSMDALRRDTGWVQTGIWTIP